MYVCVHGTTIQDRDCAGHSVGAIDIFRIGWSSTVNEVLFDEKLQKTLRSFQQHVPSFVLAKKHYGKMCALYFFSVLTFAVSVIVCSVRPSRLSHVSFSSAMVGTLALVISATTCISVLAAPQSCKHAFLTKDARTHACTHARMHARVHARMDLRGRRLSKAGKILGLWAKYAPTLPMPVVVAAK